MSLPAVSQLKYGVDYRISAEEIAKLLLRDCVSDLPDYSDSFFSVVNHEGVRFTITRFKKEDVTPPLDTKVIWVWQKVSAMAVHKGESSRADLKGLQITCTPIEGSSDSMGFSIYEVFAQKKEK
jgi:hypothetical protein